ncbi:MAG: putrescine transport system substrate-binding protein [Gammaproteobacteria bacterium]|jgi:putrescine transport system substrate-binding protein
MKKPRFTSAGTITSIAAAVMIAGSTAASAAGVLNVTNWGEYIGEDTIANFEKEYDVKVTYDAYDSQESVDAKLLAGNSGYDVVSHAGSAIARLIPSGILQKLDKSKLSNFKHMRPEIMTQLATGWDPGNQHIVPYMWGTHGVTYNEALVKETYPDAPIGSLDMIFDPRHMKELSKCGVAFLDSPADIIPMGLAYLGLDPSSTKKSDYKEVEALLTKIRPYIKTFDNYAYQRMPQKEFCVAVTWGPDGLLAMSGAEDAETGVVLDFFLPPGKGAATLWIDGWVIPQGAKNIDNAHLFMNYMMRPEVAAADSNYLWYATANADAMSLIDEAVTSSPAAFPTKEQVANMYTGMPLPPKMERTRTRAWTSFKSGN